MRPELDVHEVNATINKLKALDLQIADRNQIQQLLSRLYNHIGVVYKLNQGQFIQRGITLKAEEDYPKGVQRISYNPNGSAMGRCNFAGEAMFYGCIASDVMEGYHTTAFEILPLSDDEMKNLPVIRQHRVIVGNWILSKETEFLTIGLHNNLSYGNTAARNRNNVFNSMISNYQKSILSYYAIDRFLAHEFSKVVPKNEAWRYKISAVYVDMLKAHGHPGLIYPSVKSAGAGMNIIIFPEFVRDNLISFDRCAYGIFYVRAKEIVNEWLMRADALEENLIWKDDYNRIPTPLRNYYKGLSDVNPSRGKIKMVNLDHKPDN
jgi:hypothetical protein